MFTLYNEVDVSQINIFYLNLHISRLNMSKQIDTNLIIFVNNKRE